MKKIENLDIGHVRHSFEENFKVKISEVSDDHSLETDFPHRHNFFMVCLVLNGHGTHSIDFEKIEVKPNRLFFVKPEQVHFWEVHPKSELAVIQFSIDFLTQLFSTDSIPSIHSPSGSYADLKAEEADKLFELFKKIESEARGNHNNSGKILKALVFILLAEIEVYLRSEGVQKTKGYKSEITENFKRLLNQNYKRISTVKEYSGMLNITPNYLNIVVKNTTGYTANELMHQRILLEAKRELINSKSDVSQIAFDLGFRDASYFSRFFKKASGLTPSEFRQSIYKIYQHTND